MSCDSVTENQKGYTGTKVICFLTIGYLIAYNKPHHSSHTYKITAFVKLIEALVFAYW